MELLPVFLNGAPRFFVGLCPDFILIWDDSRRTTKLFIMVEGGAVDVTDLLVRGYIPVSLSRFDVASKCAFLRPAPGCTWCSLNEAAKVAMNRLERVLKGREVILCFSGGKDSSSLLAIMSTLTNYIDFSLRVIYVYIPFLDDVSGPKIASEMCKRLGFDLEVLEAKRRDVKSYLKWRGMPKIGRRWCTMFKTKPVRNLVKGKDSLVILADRATESPKRCLKLLRALYSLPRSSLKKVYPLVDATLLDVVIIAREVGLVHPIYLAGGVRVSCALCPYKTLYEFSVLEQNVEDPGFIESVLKKEFERRYRRYMSFETFTKFHLWRFEPRTAYLLHKIQKHVSTMLRENAWLSYEEIRNWISSLWIERLRISKIDPALIKDLCSTRSSLIS